MITIPSNTSEETVTSIQPLSDQEKKRQALVAALVDFIGDAINTQTKEIRDELIIEIGKNVLTSKMIRDEVNDMIQDGDIGIYVDASLSV